VVASRVVASRVVASRVVASKAAASKAEASLEVVLVAVLAADHQLGEGSLPQLTETLAALQQMLRGLDSATRTQQVLVATGRKKPKTASLAISQTPLTLRPRALRQRPPITHLPKHDLQMQKSSRQRAQQDWPSNVFNRTSRNVVRSIRNF
jgi:hypothetical protein